MATPATVTTYVARRRLKMAPGVFRNPAPKGRPVEEGQLVPEAHLWFREESYLHTGELREVEVTPKQLQEAMDEFEVPADKQKLIRTRVGLGTARVRGAHRSPSNAANGFERPPHKDAKVTTNDGPVPEKAPRKPSVKRKRVRKTANKPVEVQEPAQHLEYRKSTTPVIIPLRVLDEEPDTEFVDDGDHDSIL